ncbi:hypothetical protein C2W64_01499 [Brevibacillus laterosporus]|nr:hypothetical protein C2W64_01499 [Brevibacillus laterosporus]
MMASINQSFFHFIEIFSEYKKFVERPASMPNVLAGIDKRRKVMRSAFDMILRQALLY